MISESVIRYGVAEFETALRQMGEARAPIHTFKLSDNPPISVLVMLVPTSTAEQTMDELQAGGTLTLVPE